MAELFAHRFLHLGSLVFHPGQPQRVQTARILPYCDWLALSSKRVIRALGVVLLLALPAWSANSTQSEPPQAPVLPSSQQGPRALPDVNADTKSPLTPKQQRELMKSNFDRMKRDADELAGLAKSLQQDLDKSNQNVLSLKVLDRAEKIEKLAKKIKTEAKGD